MDLRRKKSVAPARRLFVSLADRRKWMGAKFDGMFNADPAYYKPLLAPTEEGRLAYLKAFEGRSGCGAADAPTDLEMWAVLLNVVVPKGLDAKVMLHCDRCLPCLVKLGRMLHHFVAERPGSEWSNEVGHSYPLLVRSWDSDKYHFRVYLSSLINGPSFHVYAQPFDRTKCRKPLIIGSCAGIFGDGDYPLKDLVLRTQKEMEQRARVTRKFTDPIDPVTVVQFALALGFATTVDKDIYDFLAGASSHG